MSRIKVVSNPINLNCPITNLSDIGSEGRQFYSPKHNHEKRPTPWKRQRPTNQQLLPVSKDGAAEMIIDKKRWIRVEIEATWSLASDDANAPAKNSSTNDYPKTPRHLHTEFMFEGKTIHIDFVRFMSGGADDGA